MLCMDSWNLKISMPCLKICYFYHINNLKKYKLIQLTYFFFFNSARVIWNVLVFLEGPVQLKARARLMRDDIFFDSRSEHVGPTYAVMSQSHEYEFHCSTHVPWLSHMSCVHILLSPAGRRRHRTRMKNKQKNKQRHLVWLMHY